MSKEMTPKDALQIILDNLTPRVLGIFPVEFHIVKEALDRLELLEKNNQEIEKLYLNENKHWCETIDSLRKENQELKFDNELICKLAYDRQVENEKLKKIIEIIINKRINVVFFKACKDIKEANIYRSKENKLTQQEYDLLKEFLK